MQDARIAWGEGGEHGIHAVRHGTVDARSLHLDSWLEGDAALQGAAQGDLVRRLQVPAHRHPLGDL